MGYNPKSFFSIIILPFLIGDSLFFLNRIEEALHLLLQLKYFILEAMKFRVYQGKTNVDSKFEVRDIDNDSNNINQSKNNIKYNAICSASDDVLNSLQSWRLKVTLLLSNCFLRSEMYR